MEPTLPRSIVMYAAITAIVACTGNQDTHGPAAPRAAYVPAAPAPAATTEVTAAAEAELPRYEHEETRELVTLVDDAAAMIETRGEGAFAELGTAGSRWRQGETYVFVLDPEGTMVVHPDPEMEGKDQLDLQDVNGRPIVRGLIAAVAGAPGTRRGWYHYEWPVPGGLLPRWKSSYVRLATAPSGKLYIAGAGMYDDRMERAFVVDMVNHAVAKIATMGRAAFPLFYDRTGPFVAKDAYVFVMDAGGVELVNPAFPNLEGRNLLGVKDTQGKEMVREMLAVAERQGSGWVEYMWPKPGESVSTEKSTYVRRVEMDGRWLLVGSGVYLADAPKTPPDPQKPTAGELTALVREGAALLEQRGEDAFAEFRRQGSKWFHDDTYLFVMAMDGMRLFHAADPSLEGKNVRDAKDIHGRPYGEMFLEAASSPSGEGWVHYMYPEPGHIIPAWKSTFIKRVRLPSGEQRVLGAGIYDMKMDRAFVVDLVDRAAALVAKHGEHAFDRLRDRTGPFVFMDTYVFVTAADGTELVNPVHPTLEGRNLLELRDVKGKALAKEYIDAAMKRGSAWVDYHWYKPGENTPTRKEAYVRRVKSDGKTYVVGSGRYLDD